MDIVVDANVVFSILIKESLTKKIFLDENLGHYAPESIFSEFEEHKLEILAKTQRDEEDFNRTFALIKSRVKSVPETEFEAWLEEAESLLEDKDDAAYLALCLASNMPLWSNDKGFLEQKRVRIFTTHDLKKHLGIE